MAATGCGARDAAQVTLHQRDAGRFHRDVGARAHRDADVRLRQRRRVVDAVAGHRDAAAGLLQLGHHRAFLVRQHLGLDVGDAEPARHRLRRGAVVAGEHDDADAFRFERGDCFSRAILNGIDQS